MPIDIDVVLLDTQILRSAGATLNNPDLQKILARAKKKELEVVIAHVAWEEWRTHQLSNVHAAVKNARAAYAKVVQMSNRGLLAPLPPVDLPLPSDEQLNTDSQNTMKEFAIQQGITIKDLDPAHSARAWKRYFSLPIELPFNAQEEKREERRKDIPDSWILEAAIDLKAGDKRVVAICNDGRLGDALEIAGIVVYKNPEDLVRKIEASEATPQPAQPAVAPLTTPQLLANFTTAFDTNRDTIRRVFGIVAYLTEASKEELAGTLSKTGISDTAAEAALAWLVLNGYLRDTGNNYIVPDKQLSPVAAASVEEEMIALLKSK